MMNTRLYDWLLETWYGDTGRGRWLQPLAWLYAGLEWLHRTVYRQGWLQAYRSRRVVVVVGNLTAGGTGKTPFVIWLAENLRARDMQVGVATRGYGATGTRTRRVMPHDDAMTVGDEACMLRRRLNLPVVVGADRAQAIRLLEKNCEVILCDDGLQHHGLVPDIEIAVVDGARGFGNGRLLPAGPLREPAARLDTVDMVVINGPGFQWPTATAIAMRLEPLEVVALDGRERRPLADFAGRAVIAAAAIGNPGRFFAMLRSHGLAVEERAFPDHAAMTPSDAGAGKGKPVLMTEKDAVKCAGGGWRDTWYVTVEARIEGRSAERLIERVMNETTARMQGAPQS
jgi:tetraacyldisaccharide 4'-kinase